MTLEGEYYMATKNIDPDVLCVAILMTLEGEYYGNITNKLITSGGCRNPHDIGRRILLSDRVLQTNGLWGRNPHDIGRRILLILLPDLLVIFGTVFRSQSS